MKHSASKSIPGQPGPANKLAAFSRDLEKRLPHLLHIWRKLSRIPGPVDKLLSQEIQMIGRDVRTLSLGLTRERELAGAKYFSDPAWLGAYLLYFWPISYIQARYALHSLIPKPQHILELGAGAGPLSAAARDLGIQQTTLADRSPQALDLARQLFLTRQPQPAFIHWDPQQELGRIPGQYDLISCQHVLNELWVKNPIRLEKLFALLLSLKDRLTPHGSLLLIEPALTPTSRALLQLRDRFLASGWQVAAPCLLHSACPALFKDNDSCHLDLPWQALAWLKPLALAAGFKKTELKMTYLLLFPPAKKNSTQDSPELFLIVSEPMLSKNKRIRYIGCGPLGRMGLAIKPEDIRDHNKIFLTLRRGDTIRVLDAEKTESGLRILPQTKIQLIKRL